MAPAMGSATPACWYLTAGTANTCANQHIMNFWRPGTATTTTLDSSASCNVLACPPAGSTPTPPPGC
jgi:hypothetical protein